MFVTGQFQKKLFDLLACFINYESCYTERILIQLLQNYISFKGFKKYYKVQRSPDSPFGFSDQEMKIYLCLTYQAATCAQSGRLPPLSLSVCFCFGQTDLS